MDEKVLYLVFKTTIGNKATISIDDPNEDITEEQIVTAMNTIKDSKIFEPNGHALETCISAKVVNSETTEYDLKV